ncbi:MAG TPA: Ig-like domain-containing protein [Gemmatimonadales bacterium]
MLNRKLAAALGTATILLAFALPAAAQQPTAATPEAGRRVTTLRAEPPQLVIERGRTVPLSVTGYDAQGAPVNAMIRYAGSFRALRIRDGQVLGLVPGEYEIVATVVVPPGSPQAPPSVRVPVVVRWPEISQVSLSTAPGRLYAGTTLRASAKAVHADGSVRPDPAVTWTASDPNVATVDRYGFVTARRPGNVTITAAIEGKSAAMRLVVPPFPGASLEARVSQRTARTGDVVHLSAVVRGRNGATLPDVPITWSYTYLPDDSIAAPGATAAIEDTMFVAELSGVFTILATAGQLTDRVVVDVRPRDVVQPIQMTGQGSIRHVHTSDLWPWTGRNGRDYALVGTWGGDGWAYVYDITDLEKMVKTDSIRVDARTINDVTVSPDGRYGALSREGASNRINGVVILDLADPAHPKVASEYSETLTGGVHNMFATNDYLFALSGGDKYVIIDVRNLSQPRYVSEYNHPDSYIHDVWFHDGIAYSSEWGTGVVVVDVGNGKYGGSIEQPKLIATFPTKSGATHEVYPYVQPKTGKVYLFLGDEIMSRQGRAWAGTRYELNRPGGIPQTMAGYTHIVDFTDPKNPRNIARYENPEFGSHDIIVENDVLYQAYYDGGLRVIDVSGELMGNLAEQGREIAVFKPYDPAGFTANAPMVMNAMPWKGHILFTDFNSGLWAAKLEPRTTPVP